MGLSHRDIEIMIFHIWISKQLFRFENAAIFGGRISVLKKSKMMVGPPFHVLDLFLFQFLHQLIDQICKQRGPQFKDFSHIWNIRDWISVTDSWAASVKSWVGCDSGKEEVCTV